MEEIKNVKKIILTEVCKGEELHNKLFLEKKKYCNEKVKRICMIVREQVVWLTKS